MHESLRNLLATQRRYVVLVGNSREALETLLVASKTAEMQQHVYILMQDRNEPVPTIARRAMFGVSPLILWRPSSIDFILHTITLAEQHLQLS
jgi:hypothetical protein